ncbi:cytochrome P450 2G1-like [Lissotriton helveticus]
MDFGAAASLVLAVCISCLLFINAWRKRLQRANLPPGPTPLPLVGNLFQVDSKGLVKYLQSVQDTYGPVFTFYMGPHPVVFICGYKALKEAFIDQGDDFVFRGAMPAFDRIFHNSGMTVANNERWKQLSQFSFKTLKNLGMGKTVIEDKISEEAQCMVDFFRKTEGRLCEPSLGLAAAPANIIFGIVFGERFDYEDEKFLTLLKDIADGFDIMSSIWGQLYDIFPGAMYYLPGPHNKVFKIFLKLEALLLDQVKSHQETLNSTCPRDFIDYFLIRMNQEKQKESSEFHIQNLIPTIMDIIFGGVETMSNTLIHGVLLLLKHPEIQDKIHEEIDRETGQHRSPTYQDRKKMPFTNAVVHEIQRFCDLVPMGMTHAVARNTMFRGYTIPKGTDVIPFLTTALKDPTHFKDPENFNPENFLDNYGGFMKNNALVPFSIGKRSCPGESLARAKIFMFLTALLQNFSLKSPINPEDIDLTPRECGLENLPPLYKLYFVPREENH